MRSEDEKFESFFNAVVKRKTPRDAPAATVARFAARATWDELRKRDGKHTNTQRLKLEAMERKLAMQRHEIKLMKKQRDEVRAVAASFAGMKCFFVEKELYEEMREALEQMQGEGREGAAHHIWNSMRFSPTGQPDGEFAACGGIYQYR